MLNEFVGGYPTVPTQDGLAPANKVIWKWGEWEEEKREGVKTKMTEKFKDILTKEEEAIVARNEMK